jgi:hypothetical protein
LFKTHDFAYSNAMGLPNESALVLNADLALLGNLSTLNFSTLSLSEATFVGVAALAFLGKTLIVDLPLLGLDAIKSGAIATVDFIGQQLHTLGLSLQNLLFTNASGDSVSTSMGANGQLVLSTSLTVEGTTLNATFGKTGKMTGFSGDSHIAPGPINNSKLTVQTTTSPSTPQGKGSTDLTNTATDVSQGYLIKTSTTTVSMHPADVNAESTGKAAALAASNIVANGFRPGNFNLAQWFLDGLNTVTKAVGNFFNGAKQLLTSAWTNVANLFSSEVNYTDPVILDLNGDGVKLTNYTETPVLFDIDHDGGSLEVTGWVTPQDGIVVHDLNGNGVIDNMSETLSEYYNGTVGTGGDAGQKTFTNGFTALASLDTGSGGVGTSGYHDNVFNSADAAWNNLRVWVDANSDAKTDAGELKTFAQLGITQINLTNQVQSGEVRDGNEVLSRGTFVQSGQTKEAIAASFLANPNGTIFTPSGTGTQVSTEGNITSYVSSSATGEVIDVAAKGVKNAYGAQGNDTLIGDANDNWLAGGVGSDTFNAGGGNHLHTTRKNRRAMRRRWAKQMEPLLRHPHEVLTKS